MEVSSTLPLIAATSKGTGQIAEILCSSFPFPPKSLTYSRPSPVLLRINLAGLVSGRRDMDHIAARAPLRAIDNALLQRRPLLSAFDCFFPFV